MNPGTSLPYGIYRALSVILIVLYAPCLYAEQDNSLRADLNLSYKINKQFRSVSYIFIQADEDVTNYDYVEMGTGLVYQTRLSWLSFLAYYQLGCSKREPDHWLAEHKPSVNLNTSATLGDFRISNQIRYEHRITPGWNDYRIKNTLEISRPDMTFQPGVGWELFYENHDQAVMLNRIKFSIARAVSDHVTLGPYYRIDFSNLNHQWELSRHLVGFQVTVKY